MSHVTFAKIRAVHRIIEMGRALIGIISSPVQIIELKAYTYFLSRVYAEFSCKVVVAVGSVSSGEIRNIGKRGERVGELKFIYRS